MAFATPATSAGGQQTVDATRDAALRERLDADVPRWLAAAKVPSIAIAVIRNGVVAWTRVYGEQSPGVTANDRTLYNVASLTKPVFAEVLLRLAGERTISLDERMSRHWVDPDVRDDPRARLLTPRLALSHQTGFANWRRESGGTLRFSVRPGTAFGYSGEGYEYASVFVQRKLGASLQAIAQRTLFHPLAMRSTSLVRQPWFEGRVALPSDQNGAFKPADISSTGNAADNLYTTIGDYATFVAAVALHRGLPDSFARQRDSLHVPDTSPGNACNASKVPVCPVRIGHGLGWSVQEYASGKVLWHTGADEGERSMVFLFPDSGDGAVLLTNGAAGFNVIIDVGLLLFPQSPFAGFLRAGK